jgi:hypothetical protein
MRLFFSAFFLLLVRLCAAQQPALQDSVRIFNPSFEDTPRASASPAGWSTSTPGSTPDIMPGAWGVQCAPQDGQSCLALVTREDGTVEDVGQRLDVALKKDSCYTFSLFLAHSTQYVGYNLPVRLRVWGGETPGQKTVLLTSTPLISHSEWKAYKLQFVPTANMRSITLEAYYAPGTLFKYRGNILLDHCSAIWRCNRA